MRKQKRITKKLNKKEQKKLHDHLDHHVCKYYHKHFHIAHHSHHNTIHLGELMLVLLVWCMSRIFAGTVWLPSNDNFIYPLQEVSTIECRTEYRNEMDPSCKINLPKITNANYELYKNSTIHRQLYTVLRAAPYKAWRDQTIWAHAWLDIATARGTPLYSIGNWQVTYAWRQNGYGNVVKVKYLFRWKYIHAVYAHMDIIEVEAWDMISQGTRIGTVWNSWTTFGALGWFHVHFELTKDNRWRPMYGYLGCPDLAKWHMTIIQEWLCREQLLNNHYDPIVLFEQNRLWHVIPENNIEPKNDLDEESTEEDIDENDNQEDIKKPDSKEDIDNIPSETKTDITPKESKEDKESEENINNSRNPIETTQDSENTHPTANPEPVIDSNIKKDTSNSQNTEEIETEKDNHLGEKIIIDTSNFDDKTKHFFSTHDLYINNHTGNNTRLQVGSKKEIEINFYKKWTESKFIGVLPFTIELIPSQTNIKTNMTNINLISPNPTIIQVNGLSIGRSALIISINNQTIEKIIYTIQ